MLRKNMGLYRGKRRDTGEWVEGYLAGYDLICPGEPQDVSHATGEYYGETPYVGFIEVDPSTVGRFTGQPDKNGKRVFEGDIVSTGKERRVVRFRNGAFELLRRASGVTMYDLVGTDVEYEVIGDIHDKPELLEVNEND